MNKKLKPAFKRPEHPGRWLDSGLVTLALLAYLLLLTGNFFLPFAMPFGLIFVLVALLIGLGGRFYLTYRPDRTALSLFSAHYWPLAVLGVALLVGGILRLQTLRSAELSGSAQSFAQEALRIVTTSDWQPRSFVQPPLYLYLGATLAELQFVQQASAGKMVSPEEVAPANVVNYLRYANLALGLLALLPVYAAASRLAKSALTGLIASLLLATSWLAYQSTPALLPQTLSAALVASSFYFGVRGWQNGSGWAWAVAGGLAGLATASSYGAVLLLGPLSVAAVWQAKEGRRWKGLGAVWGSGLVGWMLAAPGWIFSLPSFVTGLTALDNAPPEAASFYARSALANDAGLVIAFAAAVAMALSLRSAGLWLVLAFPLLYLPLAAFFGPPLLERLTLVVPLAAIAAAWPLGVIAQEVQRLLDAHDDRHKWGSVASGLGLAVAVVLVSVMVRRFL